MLSRRRLVSELPEECRDCGSSWRLLRLPPYSPQCLVRQWIHILLCAMCGSTVDTHLRQFLEAMWTNFPIFYVPVDLGPRDLALFVPNVWLDAGFVFSVSSRYSWKCFTYFLREGADSDPEVAAVLLYAADEPQVTGSLLSACLARGIQEFGFGRCFFSFAGLVAPRAVLPDSGMCKAGFAFCAVFPLVVARPKMLGILVGMDQKDSCALVVVTAVACAWLVLLIYAPLAVFPSFVDRPRMLCIHGRVWTRRTFMQCRRPCRLHRCSPSCCNDRCYGPDSAENCLEVASLFLSAHTGFVAEEGAASLVVDWFCWLRCTCCVSFDCAMCVRMAAGPCFAQVQFLDRLLRLLDVAVATPQVQFLVTVYVPVVGASGAVGQTAQKTVEILPGAVLGRFRPDSADTREDSTVAVLKQGQRHVPFPCSFVHPCLHGGRGSGRARRRQR